MCKKWFGRLATLPSQAPPTQYTQHERGVVLSCDVLCWNVDVTGRDPFDPYHTGNLGETQAADTKFVSVWQPSRTDTCFGCRISKRTRQPKQNKHLKWREERVKEQQSVSLVVHKSTFYIISLALHKKLKPLWPASIESFSLPRQRPNHQNGALFRSQSQNCLGAQPSWEVDLG